MGENTLHFVYLKVIAYVSDVVIFIFYSFTIFARPLQAMEGNFFIIMS